MRKATITLVATLLVWLGMLAMALRFSPLAGVFVTLFGAILARPITNFASALHRQAQDIRYRHLNGNYYEFDGYPMVIHTDRTGTPWIDIQSVRSAFNQIPSDPVLKRIFGDQIMGDIRPRIHVDALIAYFRKAHDPRSIRFKRWLERDVAFPAQNRKKNTSSAR